jgi:hypothetical protein
MSAVKETKTASIEDLAGVLDTSGSAKKEHVSALSIAPVISPPSPVSTSS